MDHRENFGILGTPLRNGVTGEFKLSTQNKIAPTSTVYAKLKQTEIAKEERNLLQGISVLATNGDNLYANDGGCADLGELMDKEDRTHFRARETIKRTKVNAKINVSLQQSGGSSFLAKSAEIPEIVPKQGRTGQGYGVLQRVYSLRGVEESKFVRKVGSSALHQASLYSSTELFRSSSTGLGYRDEEETIRKAEHSKLSWTLHALREKKDLKTFEEVTLSDYDDSEDDDMNELANAGYKDLDSTAKFLSQRVQESRANSNGRSSSKKRTVGNVDLTLEEGVRFSQFTQPQVIDGCLAEMSEYEIPSSFAADPTHRFETDSMKITMIDLPEHIRQEYAANLKVYTENRKKETEVSRNAIANAKEEQHARSRRIRDLIVKDMGCRFMEPNELKMPEKAPGNLECGKLGAICNSLSTESPKRGKARRTSQPWEPENLLFKRLGVETGKPIFALNSPKTKAKAKAPGSRELLSSYDDDDDEFLIHSAMPASAGILGLQDENILTSGRLAKLHGYEDFQTTDVNMCNYGASISSNPRLAQAIFTNEKIGAAQEAAGNLSSEAKLGRNSKRNDYNRGVHRTRALDFF